MAVRDALFPAEALASGIDYFPILSSRSSGINSTGVDSGLKYQSGTLTTTNLQVTNINGSVPISGINTLFPKITLSPTWVSYGDSFTSGGVWSPIWATYLATLTGTTLINKGVSGSTSDYATCINSITDDPIKTPAYANYNSVVMYGFNDLRNSKSLYTQFYAWTQNILSLALTLSLPQNRIQDPRDASWTKSGVWTNAPVYGFGLYSTTTNDYIEKNMGTIRYLAVRHTMVHAVNTPCNWELKINGVIRNTFKWTTQLVAQSNVTYRTGAYIIDLGADTANAVVRLTNLGATALNQTNFVDFVAGWTSADFVNARQVLFLSIPRFNFEETGAAPFDAPTDAKRIQMNEGTEHVALMCRRVGLPVSFFRISEASGNFYTDSIHPQSFLSNKWANEIKDFALV